MSETNFVENIPQDFGALNYEIMKLRKENEFLKENQKQEIEEKYENSILELTEKTKQLERENEKLKHDLSISVPIEQMNASLHAATEELSKTQDKLKETHDLLEEQQRLTSQLKSQLLSHENISEESPEIEDLRQQLISSNKENEKLKQEFEEMQEQNSSEIEKLAQHIAELQRDNLHNEKTETNEGENVEKLHEKIKLLEEKLRVTEKMRQLNNENIKTEIELRILAEKRANESYETLMQKKGTYEESLAENEACVSSLMKIMGCSFVELIPTVQELVAEHDKLKDKLIERENDKATIDSLHKEIETIRNSTVDKKVYDLEKRRISELESQLALSKQNEAELKEQMQIIIDENEKKTEYNNELHQQEVASFEDDIKEANDKIKKLEQEKMIFEKAKMQTQTQHRSFTENSNLTTNLSELTSTFHESPNSDSGYIELVKEAATTVIKYVSESHQDNFSLLALAAFLESLIKRPFDFDGFSTNTENLVNIIDALHSNYNKQNDLIENQCASFKDITILIDKLNGKLDAMHEKIGHIDASKLVAHSGAKIQIRPSKIPKPALKPNKMISPRRRELNQDAAFPPARKPF